MAAYVIIERFAPLAVVRGEFFLCCVPYKVCATLLFYAILSLENDYVADKMADGNGRLAENYAIFYHFRQF